MRKNVFISLILCVLLLGFGSAFAASSQVDNLPGGAGISYWHASAAGDVTLLNIQNISFTAVMVHVTIYDQDSVHKLDFNVPLSGKDNWGAAISGNGTNITVTPQTPCFFGGLNNGCFTPLVRAIPAGADGLQKGYVTMAISSIDVVIPDGDPRNDGIFTGIDLLLPNWIFGRTALLNPTAGSAIALNSTMLQDFHNIAGGGGLFEAADGYDTIANVGVAMNYNCDADTIDSFATSDDPAQGLNIDSWEILLTSTPGGAEPNDVVADAGFIIYNALGSGNQAYWGRYNENPAVPSETVLITVMPANSGVNHAPACGYSSRAMSVFSFDDNEFSISTPVSVPEVARTVFGPAGIAVPGTSGEAQIVVDAPMFGFTYTEAGNFADLYPLVREGIWVNALENLAATYVTDPAESEVIFIGL